MAEGILRRLAAATVEVYSAGANPSQVNPFAIKAMSARGIDISSHRSDGIKRYLDQEFDYVITVRDNAAENCPVFPGPAKRIHWNSPDPAAVTGDDSAVLQSFINVRDGLERKLRQWLKSHSWSR